MLNRSIDRVSAYTFAGFSLISVASIMAAWYTEAYFLAAIPLILIIAFISYIDIRKIFFFLLFCIPCSIEFQVSDSLQTDLPTEPLIAGLMLVFFVFVFLKPEKFDFRFFKHPAILLIAAQFVWAIIVSMNSIEPLLSGKYLLAKLWYLSTFVFLGGAILRTEKDMRSFFWAIFIPISILTIVTLIRYIPLHFEFDEVNKTMTPYFRNKVSYGTTLTIFFPFLFLAAHWYEKGSWKYRIIQLSKPLLLAGVYFSYTRACVLALVLAAICYFVIKWKLVKSAFILAIVSIAGFVGYMAYHNEFMDHAPVYEKTVQHDKYEEHLAATVSFEDASSMERIYMWLGGIYMYTQKPVIGSGPNTFYPNYKKYTVKSFETYLSDNDEKLTIHNYFLLTLLEQGAVGLLLFLCLIFAILAAAQKAYHRLQEEFHKRWLIACTLSFVMVIVSLALSDLIETDKVGSIYFMDIAMIVNLSIMTAKGKSKTEAES